MVSVREAVKWKYDVDVYWVARASVESERIAVDRASLVASKLEL